MEIGYEARCGAVRRGVRGRSAVTWLRGNPDRGGEAAGTQRSTLGHNAATALFAKFAYFEPFTNTYASLNICAIALRG